MNPRVRLGWLASVSFALLTAAGFSRFWTWVLAIASISATFCVYSGCGWAQLSERPRIPVINFPPVVLIGGGLRVFQKKRWRQKA